MSKRAFIRIILEVWLLLILIQVALFIKAWELVDWFEENYPPAIWVYPERPNNGPHLYRDQFPQWQQEDWERMDLSPEDV